jgi:hypothetical protein
MDNLEKITNQFLEDNGATDLVEKSKELDAETYTETLSEQIKPKEEFKIIEGGNFLRLLDNKGFQKAYVEFYFDGEIGEKYLYLNHIESQESDQGYFGQLFKKLKKLAKKQERASYILLEVDTFNEDAISVFENFGFYKLGSFEGISRNTDRITMRRDL